MLVSIHHIRQFVQLPNVLVGYSRKWVIKLNKILTENGLPWLILTNILRKWTDLHWLLT